MLAKWMNTHAYTAAEMLEITDKTIMDMSNGEVLNPAPHDEDDPYEDSMTDASIFGKMGNDDGLMGHITLPVPIVNIQYLFGTKPILPKILGMSRNILASIVYYGAYVVTDPADSKTIYKQVIPAKDALSFHEAHPGATLMTGAEAIDFMLTKDGAKEKDYIILHMLPVIPISLRYKKIPCKQQKEAWYPYPMEYLYNRLIFRKKRLIRLKELKAPEVILLNETRMLQEYADALISNGAHGLPYVTPAGFPAESLQELAEAISIVTNVVKKPVMPDCETVDQDKINKLLLIIYPPQQNMEDEENEEESKAPYDPDDDPQEKAEKEILEILRPFTEAAVRENFPEYDAEYHEPMCRFAEHSISKSLCTLDPDKAVEPQLIDGIVETVRMTIKKQTMYL